MLKLLPLLAVMLCAVLSPASAARALTAEEAHARITELKEEILTVQNEAPLGINNLTLVERVDGYGDIIPLQSPSIPQGSALILYFEPTNWRTVMTQELYRFHIAQDILLENAAGEPLFQQEGFLQFKRDTTQPTMDLFVKNTVNLGALPPGDYRIKGVLHDVYAEAQVPFEIPFSITPPQ